VKNILKDISDIFVFTEKCFICEREEEHPVSLDRFLKLLGIRSKTPNICSLCRKEYLESGVALLSSDGTDWMILTNEAFKDLFKNKIPKNHIVFVDKAIIEKLKEISQ
jgi:hypothetical protein